MMSDINLDKLLRDYAKQQPDDRVLSDEERSQLQKQLLSKQERSQPKKQLTVGLVKEECLVGLLESSMRGLAPTAHESFTEDNEYAQLCATHPALSVIRWTFNYARTWSESRRIHAVLLYSYARDRGLSRDEAEDVRDWCLEVVTRKIREWRQVTDDKVVDTGCLVHRLKTRSDAEAWDQFHELYVPLLYGYARARGLSRDDAEIVCDSCLKSVHETMPTFDDDKEQGGFKNWLMRVAERTVRKFVRIHPHRKSDSEEIRSIPDAGPSPAEIWEQSWRTEHLKYYVEKARGQVSERNFRAFQMLQVDNCTVEEVCTGLGLNPDQVYEAKARVLKHVKRIMDDFEAES